jgi:hypothetical protein
MAHIPMFDKSSKRVSGEVYDFEASREKIGHQHSEICVR